MGKPVAANLIELREDAQNRIFEVVTPPAIQAPSFSQNPDVRRLRRQITGLQQQVDGLNTVVTSLRGAITDLKRELRTALARRT
jgi:hypothetical protein